MPTSSVIARRRADATPKEAAADLAAMSAQFRVRFPERYASESAKALTSRSVSGIRNYSIIERDEE